jgi:hypothetical protein
VVRESLPFAKKSLAPDDPALSFAHRYVDTEGNLDVESKSTGTIRDMGAERQEELERLVTRVASDASDGEFWTEYGDRRPTPCHWKAVCYGWSPDAQQLESWVYISRLGERLSPLG